MEWFEKEYKKRFEDESTMDGVESGVLWDQISKSIPEENVSKSFPYWRWTSIMLLFLGSAFLWTFLQDDITNVELPFTQSNPSIHSNENQEQNVISDKVISQLELDGNEKGSQFSPGSLGESTNQDLNSINDLAQSSQDLPSSKSSSKFSDIAPPTIPPPTSPPPTSPPPPTTTTSSSSSSSSSSSLEQTNEVNESVEKSSSTANLDRSKESLNQTSIVESEQQRNSFQKQNKNQIRSQIQESNSPLTTEGTSQITAEKIDKRNNELMGESVLRSVASEAVLDEAKTRTLIKIDKVDLLKMKVFDQNKFIEMPPLSPTKITTVRKNPFAFQVQSGINFFDLKYSEDQILEPFASDANASLGSMQLGNSLALKLEYILNNSWSISAGFELNNYENQLNTQLISGTMILDDMQKIRKAVIVRTVRQHNKLSTFSIPLSIAYEIHISDGWSLGTSIGASYAIIRSQKGRLLGRDIEILDYSDNENRQFENFLSMRINPYLKYQIRDNVSLSFDAGVSIQSHGKSEILELTQKSKIYSLGIGLQYKL